MRRVVFVHSCSVTYWPKVMRVNRGRWPNVHACYSWAMAQRSCVLIVVDGPTFMRVIHGSLPKVHAYYSFGDGQRFMRVMGDGPKFMLFVGNSSKFMRVRGKWPKIHACYSWETVQSSCWEMAQSSCVLFVGNGPMFTCVIHGRWL